MSSLSRKAQDIPQIWRKTPARAGLVRRLRAGLMRGRTAKTLVDQTLARGAVLGLMNGGRDTPQVLRSTLRCIDVS